MQVFSERIKELRLKKGLKQTDVSRALSVSVQSYSAYENGREPNYETLVKIARLFDCSADYLLGLEEFPTKNDEAKILGIKEIFDLPEEEMENIEDINKAMTIFVKLVRNLHFSRDRESSINTLLLFLENLDVFFENVFLMGEFSTYVNFPEGKELEINAAALKGIIDKDNSLETKFIFGVAIMYIACSDITDRLQDFILSHLSSVGGRKILIESVYLLKDVLKWEVERTNGNNTET